MSIQRAQMQKLQEARDKLAAEIEAKTHQLAGLDQALALLREDSDNGSKPSRTATKGIVLNLLGEFNEAGLSASEVVELAKDRGQQLDRASVSSLLSRLKREQTLVLDGSKYRVAPTPNPTTSSIVSTASAPAVETTAKETMTAVTQQGVSDIMRTYRVASTETFARQAAMAREAFARDARAAAAEAAGIRARVRLDDAVGKKVS